MSRARPDFTIVLALIGVLLAIGIPSVRRGQLAIGWACIVLAALVAVLTAREALRRM